jgi:hypothetical protein
VNQALASAPELVAKSPYARGWVCVLQPRDLAGELGTLRIGNPVVPWYQAEIERLRKTRSGSDAPEGGEAWAAFEHEFLRPAVTTTR